MMLSKSGITKDSSERTKNQWESELTMAKPVSEITSISCFRNDRASSLVNSTS